MYHLGIIQASSVETEHVHTYIEALEAASLSLTYFKQAHFSNKDMSSIDGFLLFAGENTEDTLEICSLILSLRKLTTALIYVRQEEAHPKSRVVYLELGADGNFDLTSSPEECTLHLMNALKRKAPLALTSRIVAPTTFQQLSFSGSMKMNEVNLSIVLEEKEVELTKQEYSVIHLLQEQDGQTVTYQEIYQKVWKQPYHNEKHQVANVIFRIREKLENYDLDPNYIRTVRSVGYRFLCPTAQLTGTDS